MTFLWPGMLWLLLAVPALVALYVWLQRRKRKGAVRVREPRPRPCRARPRATVPPPHPACAVPAGADRDHRCDRTSDRRRHAADRTANDRHGDGRVAVDAGGRRRADAPRRRANRCEGVRTGTTLRRAHRHRDVRRHRDRRAAGHAQPGRPDRRDRPLPVPVAHGDRQWPDRFAGGAVPGRGHQHRAGAVRRRRGTRAAAAAVGARRARRREGRQGQAEEAVHAGRRRLVPVRRDHPAHRRPADDRPRSAGSREDGGGAWRAGVHGGLRHARRGRWSASRACRSTCASTRPR